MARGGDFRDGSYRKRVIVGKRTVKEGEVCAIWNVKGEHKLVRGPKRKWIFFSDVRFLDRFTADQSEYLVVKHRTGEKEHIRGPLVMHCDPVHHQSITVEKGITPENFEALVVYREVPRTDAAGKECEPEVRRRVIRGPTLFFPNANEWIHKFSWHGAPEPTKGEERNHGSKRPHALKFSKLNLTPKQLYLDVSDARTSDDAQITISLMVFYNFASIELMLDTTQDPIGDIINALGADVMSFAASRTYEQVLAQSSALSDIATFPILTQRAKAIGCALDKVVYRGLRTSSHLQEMHNKSVTNATKLRLEAAEAEQRERHLDLVARHSTERERAKAASETERADEERKRAQADHEQKLRQWRELQAAELEMIKQRHEEEADFIGRLGERGVDVTKYLVAKETSRPTHHLRVDGAAADLAQIHIGGMGGLDSPAVAAKASTSGGAGGGNAKRSMGIFG